MRTLEEVNKELDEINAKIRAYMESFRERVHELHEEKEEIIKHQKEELRNSDIRNLRDVLYGKTRNSTRILNNLRSFDISTVGDLLASDISMAELWMLRKGFSKRLAEETKMVLKQELNYELKELPELPK